MTDRSVLRALREDDLTFLERLSTDPEALGPFEWPGFTDVQARQRRWEQDGFLGPHFGMIAVTDEDDNAVGIVSWKSEGRGSPIGVTYEIGIAIMPEHRGRGLGTLAQRQLIDYLFDHTTANRIEATTNGENHAEQRSLEKAGFTREGLLRGRSFIGGRYHDTVYYGLLRADARPSS
ncbi:GNAT family N-acetyltransferase [Microlunatus sp. GCM10028923]|uniref:GNAT family N-acetyltransferase n=1 Tax=Microlunatus sp. GCM10028923 TaxID=3273400 RepID=UPI00360F689D